MSVLLEKALVLALSALICLSALAVLVEEVIPLVAKLLGQYGNRTLPFSATGVSPTRAGDF
jgi:hypothetical protein